ncbi:MAG: HAD hydrolase family protein [Erysipelotrichaceae bacterium]
MTLYNFVYFHCNVGISVAMNNAVDEVKREANFITKSNNEHGVSFFIKEYLLLD